MTTEPKSDLKMDPRIEMLQVNDEKRHALVLRAWEAINAERELKGVLAAVGRCWLPWYPTKVWL